MKQIEFFQNALANSVEILLNTETHVQAHLKWLIESKRCAIEKMAMGNVFNSDALCDYDEWEQRGLEHDTDMKVVAVFSAFSNYDLIGKLKSREKNWITNLFEIKVVFMRDPEPILKSKAKLTEMEKGILKDMSNYYQLKVYQPDGEKVLKLNQDLKYLKHKYNMAFSYSWCYGFDDILDKDFLSYGIRAKKLSITKRRNDDDDDDE